jgi:DNA-binding NarL/FixJ family response regulator
MLVILPKARIAEAFTSTALPGIVKVQGAEGVMDSLSSPKKTIHVLVAGYTRSHAELLADVIKRDRSLQVVGVASTSQEALEIATHFTIDVAAISSNLDEQPERGFDVLRALRALHPAIRVVMLLDSAKRERVVNAFRAGAKGIFSKNSPLTGLSKCVRCVHEGQIWIKHEELELILHTLSSAPTIHAVDARGLDLLTQREREVVECVAEGLGNLDIAQRLRLSKHTVKNYLFHIFDKLGVSNRVELLFLTLGRYAPNGKPDGLKPKVDPKITVGFRSRPDVPQDPLTAYVECLVAEQANLEAGIQIVAAKKRLAASMTPEQILSVERRFPPSPTKETKFPQSTRTGDETSDVQFPTKLTGS